MKVAIAFTVLCLVAYTAAQCDWTPTTCSGTYCPGGTLCKNQMIFDETFDWFNMDLWQHEHTMNGGGNGEFQWYVNDRANTRTEDGKLFIRPTLTTDYIGSLTDCHLVLDNCHEACEHWCSNDNIAPPVRSGLVNSWGGFAFKYGRVEVRAKMPAGDWLWPAVWFMPKWGVYGGWPRSGEIDLLEAKGNRNLYNGAGHNIGVEEFGSTLHFGTETYNSAWWSSTFGRASPPGQGWNTGFHNYQMEWAEWGFSFSIDNNWIGTIPVGSGFFDRGQFSGWNPWAGQHIMAPFDQEFYFIINLAIGGTNGFFPNDGNASGKPWQNNAQWPRRDFWNGRDQWLDSWRLWENNAYEASLQVDHVRVWAY